MVKYCPIMCYQNKYATHVPCMEEECAWADKDGICLIAKELKQRTDPFSALAQEYPVNQNILYEQGCYSDIDKPYRKTPTELETKKW